MADRQIQEEVLRRMGGEMPQVKEPTGQVVDYTRCKAEGCNKQAGNGYDGFCRPHARQLMREGKWHTPKLRIVNVAKDEKPDAE